MPDVACALPPQIPDWLVWIYWSTPFSWLINALVINEFKSSDYDALVEGRRLGYVAVGYALMRDSPLTC